MQSLEFDRAGFDDFAWWVANDRKTALRIIKLIEDIRRHPYTGLGHPEPLRRELAGCWSRRITQEHRLVYEVLDDRIRILACRFHY